MWNEHLTWLQEETRLTSDTRFLAISERSRPTRKHGADVYCRTSTVEAVRAGTRKPPEFWNLSPGGHRDMLHCTYRLSRPLHTTRTQFWAVMRPTSVYSSDSQMAVLPNGDIDSRVDWPIRNQRCSRTVCKLPESRTQPPLSWG